MRWNRERKKYVERSDDSFKLIAANIMIQPTPPAMQPFFTSLANLDGDSRFNYPFRRGVDVEVFIITRAAKIMYVSFPKE